MEVWEIKGEAASDSSGGEETVYVVVVGPDVPDPDHAIRVATAGKYAWYRVDSVRRVASLPAAWSDAASDPDAQAMTRFVNLITKVKP